MSSTTAEELYSASAEPAHRVEPLIVEVADNFDAVRAVWMELQACGHATPYQHMAFAETYFRCVEEPAGARLAVVVVRDAIGHPVALLPLSVRPVGPLAIARFIGGKQSNFNMPVMAPAAFALSAGSLRDALLRASKIAGVDVLDFHNQPLEWQGHENPLAKLSAMRSPSDGYKLSLQRDSDALLKRILSKDTRRKLKQKEQKLSAIGTVEYRLASTPGEVKNVLDRFFALKAERFASQGIDDPFSSDAVRKFVTTLALQGVEAGTPALELHYLICAEQVVAVFGGVAGNDRFSALLTAFDGSPDIARCSPGDIVLIAMIRNLAERGFATLDLGVGEAHYKDKVCDASERLVESFIPASAAGRILAIAMHTKQIVKRQIKSSDLGKRGIAFVRGLKAGRK